MGRGCPAALVALSGNGPAPEASERRTRSRPHLAVTVVIGRKSMIVGLGSPRWDAEIFGIMAHMARQHVAIGLLGQLQAIADARPDFFCYS
jgi:hypothetical protein